MRAVEKIYFKNLDSIRFVAAFMVFLAHGIRPSYEYLPIKDTFLEKLLNAVSNGGTGVSIFFVLSGFLITYLLITEYELTSAISIRNFYIRRVLRIWPLYYLVVAFTFFLYPVLKSLVGMNNPLASNIFYHLTFLSNFDLINVIRNFNGQDALSQDITWSVSIEEQFYLVWPLIFFFLPKRFWISAIIMVIIGSVGFRLMNDNDPLILYFHTLSVLLDLGIGGLMAAVIKSHSKIREVFERCSTWTHLALFTCSFCLILWSDSLFSFTYGQTVGRILTSTSFALVICAQASTKSDSKLNFGNFTFARKWGMYTYGIYLLHPIVITLMDVAWRLANIPKTNFISTFSFGVIAFVMTLALSKLIYTHYELRFLRMKDRFAVL